MRLSVDATLACLFLMSVSLDLAIAGGMHHSAGGRHRHRRQDSVPGGEPGEGGPASGVCPSQTQLDEWMHPIASKWGFPGDNQDDRRKCCCFWEALREQAGRAMESCTIPAGQAYWEQMQNRLFRDGYRIGTSGIPGCHGTNQQVVCRVEDHGNCHQILNDGQAVESGGGEPAEDADEEEWYENWMVWAGAGLLIALLVVGLLCCLFMSRR